MFLRPLHAALLLCAVGFNAACARAQESFDVVTIRPSAERVKFERNGTTSLSHGMLIMRDVTLLTCIHWAYGTPYPLISGKDLASVHYDLTAKAAPDATEAQMRLMMQTLLTERFHLAFHKEKQERRVYLLTVAKSGSKMHPSTPDTAPFRENGVASMTARGLTMAEFADYVSDPLGSPIVDNTGLAGRYDFFVDFRPYVDMEQRDVRPDAAAVIRAAAKGEMGLEMTPAKQTVDVLIVDRAEEPTPN